MNKPVTLAKPSTATIARQCMVALALSAAAFVLFVLPAEYDVDPTGIGSLLGIKGMSSSSVINLVENSVLQNDSDDVIETEFHKPLQIPPKFLKVNIELAPFGQVEYKFQMEKGASLSYHWAADEGLTYADLHGHKLVDGEEVLVNYQESDSVTEASGVFTTPFAGEHGWYFLNLASHTQVITLKVGGNYIANELTDLGTQLP